MKYKLNNIEKNQVEGIVARLNNAVYTYAIMQWLENFDEGENIVHTKWIARHLQAHFDHT